MPRIIQITTPGDVTEDFVGTVKEISGVVSVVVHPGVAVGTGNDLLSINATNAAAHEVIALATTLVDREGVSITTSEPRSLIEGTYLPTSPYETNEGSWEEMGALLRRSTNVSINYVALMALAGGIATIGLLTSALHLVIGAMVIAPGFEPLLRLPFGLIAGPKRLTTSGIYSTLVGYGALIATAAVTTLVLGTIDGSTTRGVPAKPLVGYWSTTTGSGVLVSALAAAGGAFVVSALRSVLTAGAMIALALIPAAAMIGIGLADGEPLLARNGLWRFLVDVALVCGVSAIVLAVKQWRTHRRRGV